MKRGKWQALLEVVKTSFNLLLVVFTIMLFTDKFIHGSIRLYYIDFDYLLAAVLLLGAILIPLQLLANDT